MRLLHAPLPAAVLSPGYPPGGGEYVGAAIITAGTSTKPSANVTTSDRMLIPIRVDVFMVGFFFLFPAEFFSAPDLEEVKNSAGTFST
jgi:hypothetical protein